MNMIMLGGLLKVAPIVKKQSILSALGQELSGRDPGLLSLNQKAIETGMVIDY
ncbi:MAG: hypothetical protein MUF15_03375 [Acidobacteria bacterium]|jgi:2-oxoglutarate ferredoxin oxidoreductase subunit gamma|nr:hypothetical protein [Acidobacteriota bacterium]